MSATFAAVADPFRPTWDRRRAWLRDHAAIIGLAAFAVLGTVLALVRL